jgi:hypothetical protein
MGVEDWAAKNSNLKSQISRKRDWRHGFWWGGHGSCGGNFPEMTDAEEFSLRVGF